MRQTGGMLAVLAVACSVALLPAGASAAVLYTQIDSGAPDTYLSQDFEAAIDDFDALAADDFVVPRGQVWQIRTAFALGDFVRDAEGNVIGGTRPPQRVNVFLFRSASGVPGAQVYGRSLPRASGTSYPNLLMATPGAVLPPGRWWLGVQPRLDYGTEENRWQWVMHRDQHGNTAAWRNPGGAWPTPANCRTFRPIQDCTESPLGSADLSFRIDGHRAPAKFRVRAARARPGGKLQLTVNAPNVGRLRVTSKQMKAKRVKVGRVGKLRVVLQPTSRTRRALRAGKRPRVQVRLRLPRQVGRGNLTTAVRARLRR